MLFATLSLVNGLRSLSILTDFVLSKREVTLELFLRFTLSVTLIVGAVVGLAFCQPEWAGPLGLDFWRWSEYEHNIALAEEQSKVLDQQYAEMVEKAQRKDQVVSELAAGRMPLMHAAQQVAALSGREFLEEKLPFLNLPGQTQREQLCHLLMRWIGKLPNLTEQQYDQISMRLEAELQTYLRETHRPHVQ